MIIKEFLYECLFVVDLFLQENPENLLNLYRESLYTRGEIESGWARQHYSHITNIILNVGCGFFGFLS